jgi:Dolichyl-phosphate-mannose-protein mannosyltransferase
VLITAGVLLFVAAVVLSRSATRYTATNGVTNAAWVAQLRPGESACQGPVVLAKDSDGVRLFVGTYERPGPPLQAIFKDGSGRIVRRGALAGGYRDAMWQVIPFAPAKSSVQVSSLCVQSEAGRVAFAGNEDGTINPNQELSVGGKTTTADLSYQLVRSGDRTLLAVFPTIFHRASLLRPSWVGAWTYYFAAALLVALALAAVGALLVGSDRRGTRVAALTVALIAFLNAAIWSVMMPAFNAPDEAAHYAYVESLGEHHRLPYKDPTKPGGSYSAEALLAIQYTALHVTQHPEIKLPWTTLEQSQWASANSTARDRRPDLVGGGYTAARSYSPFYYVLDLPAYLAVKGSDVFTKLGLMRLVSALLAGLTALAAFLFVRELFPTRTWAAALGGLAVAFQPMFAQMGGAVNNDVLVFLMATLELYVLARIWRRGMSLARAAAAGTALGLGILAKPTMIAFVPVVGAVFLYVLVRDRWRPRSIATWAGAALVPFLVLLVLNYGVWGAAGGLGGTSTSTTPEGGTPHLPEFLSYLWQWYLPRLPFMYSEFWSRTYEHVSYPLYDLFLKGFWADFGHLEIVYPGWVYGIVIAFSVLILALVGVAAVRARPRREVLAAGLLLGVLPVVMTALLVNVRAYLSLIESNEPFAQGRYLLQTIGVLGAAIAAAAVGLGDRRGRVFGVVTVMSLAAFNMFSLGLVLMRFYT